MIINENGKKILRLSLQKAVVSTIAGLLITATTFIGVGFKLAFTDHFNLGNLIIKVDKIEQSLNIDFVKKEMYAQDQKVEDQKFVSINENMESMNRHMDSMDRNIQIILNNLINK